MLLSEIVPRNCASKNLRSILRKVVGWGRITRDAKERSGERCEICGECGLEQGSRHTVEAHEIWEYDDQNRIQRLVAVQALCPNCHRVKHIGRWMKRPKHRQVLFDHMKKINEWSEEKLEEYLREVFLLYEMRSIGPSWVLDLSWLWAEYGDEASAMLRPDGPRPPRERSGF